MINWTKPIRTKGTFGGYYDFVKDLGPCNINQRVILVRSIATGIESASVWDPSQNCLENVPEKPKEIWINIYSGSMANSAWCSMPYYSKEQAVIASKNVGSLLRVSKFVEVKE